MTTFRIEAQEAIGPEDADVTLSMRLCGDSKLIVIDAAYKGEFISETYKWILLTISKDGLRRAEFCSAGCAGIRIDDINDKIALNE